MNIQYTETYLYFIFSFFLFLLILLICLLRSYEDISVLQKWNRIKSKTMKIHFI